MLDPRKVLSPFTSFLSQKQLIELTSSKVILPFYHTVTDDELLHVKHLYPTRNSLTFTRDLEYLCKYFDPIGMEELVQVIKQEKQPAKPVFHLTFDDGLSEVYEVAAPILEKKGIPATIFLNSAFVDNNGLFYRYKASLLIEQLEKGMHGEWTFGGEKYTIKEKLIQAIKQTGYSEKNHLDELAKSLAVDFDTYLSQQQPYLTTQQITTLQKKGFTFGAHSVDHPIFNSISLEEQKRQVSQCFEELNNLSLKQKYFSFPFNDQGVSKEFFQWLYLEEQCALSFGISGLKKDAFHQHLHRFPMEGSELSANNLIKTEYLYYFMKSFLGKNRVSRR